MYLTDARLPRTRQATLRRNPWHRLNLNFGRQLEENRTQLEGALSSFTTQLLAGNTAQATPLLLAFAETLNTTCGPHSSLPDHQSALLVKEVTDALQPAILDSGVANRMLSKPLGYAGDYLTIDKMYKNEAYGTNTIGRLIDRCLLDSPPSLAVRNRRGLLRGIIQEALNRSGGRVTRVTSIACGPAREISDVFSDLAQPECLKVELLDLDANAIESTTQRLHEEGLAKHVRLTCGNALRLRRVKSIKQQDLIYSIGLIDYFNDKAVVMLLDQIYDALAPGGRVVLGNFHRDNSFKTFMDHVLEWKLIHRDEADMHRLFQASRFGRRCTQIHYEETGVNLFAEASKPD